MVNGEIMMGDLCSSLFVVILAALFTACGAETTCKVCGQAVVPNVLVGYEDLREHPTYTLDADIKVEMGGTGRVIDLNDENDWYKDSCPIRFPKRLNCQYGFFTARSDNTFTVRIEADGALYKQEYSTRGIEAPCPIGTGYIKVTRDEAGYHLAKEIVLVTECEDEP